MIYVTGDTHGTIDFNKLHCMRDRFRADDLLIVAGDFGAVWHPNTLAQTLRPYRQLRCTVLFVDGNHENFDALGAFPVQTWQGGKVHVVAENILHLLRGQIFTLEGKTFLALGGAESTDKAFRREGVSWWPQESVTLADVEEGMRSLAAHGMYADYVITHTLPSCLLVRQPFLDMTGGRAGVSEMLLNIIAENAQFGHWYFGHWHLDLDLGGKFSALYQRVVPLTEGKA